MTGVEFVCSTGRFLADIARSGTKDCVGKRTGTRIIQLHGPNGTVGKWYHPKNHESADVRARQGNVIRDDILKSQTSREGLVGPNCSILHIFYQLKSSTK